MYKLRQPDGPHSFGRACLTKDAESAQARHFVLMSGSRRSYRDAQIRIPLVAVVIFVVWNRVPFAVVVG